MQRSFIYIVTLGVLLLMSAQQAWAQSSDGFNKQKLDAYIDTLFQNHKVMGSLEIDSAGQTVFERTWGFRELQDDSLRSNMETEYRIGSITKMFTATMIFQLIEEGKLSLSTKLSKFYPDIPKADSITIGNLMHHQSGIFNFTNAPDYQNYMTEKHSEKQMLQIFRGQKSQFTPGSKTSYSNTNYVLLGYIIENLTGDSYADQLQKRIVDPLKLKHTYYGDDIDPQQNEAASFRWQSGKWQKMPETDMSIPGGAGAIVSTPADLIQFIRALFNGKLVSKKSLDHMTSFESGLGMGMMKAPFDNEFAYGHTGGIDGFQSNLFYFPKEDVTVAFTGNAMDYSMNSMLIGVLSIYFGKDFTIPTLAHKEIKLNRKEMQKYVGDYSSSQLPINIKVFVEDNTLKAQASGQSSFPLTATSKTTMRFDPAGIVMEFDNLKGESYQQFTLEQNGGNFVFKRK
ncbi:MAG TPA: serine hydrolase domain-containing protein [Balneolaceae bacterium]|nr:serine hydrolase domain-containing protein [Balneolaceae bacterium]